MYVVPRNLEQKEVKLDFKNCQLTEKEIQMALKYVNYVWPHVREMNIRL